MWTPDKKVGDQVAMRQGHVLLGQWVLRTVMKVTSTQFTLNTGEKVLRSNGRVVGSDGDFCSDATDKMRKKIAESDRQHEISREAYEIRSRIEEIFSWGDGGREWLVKHIGPLLPKEGE